MRSCKADSLGGRSESGHNGQLFRRVGGLNLIDVFIMRHMISCHPYIFFLAMMIRLMRLTQLRVRTLTLSQYLVNRQYAL